MSVNLRVKALHVVFVTSWFAGLFYLPRIFVNLAPVEDVAIIRERLLMARKLLRSRWLRCWSAVTSGARC